MSIIFQSLCTVRYLQSPGELFAEKIHDCLKDEDYKTLIQIVVSRLEVIIMAIDCF